MVKSGMVVQVSHDFRSGMIRDGNDVEWYFSIDECCDLELPCLWSPVTFVKDTDYKHTPVASLVMPSKVFRKQVG
jgi:hypothetical protein